MHFSDAFQSFAQSAAPAAVTSLWQGLAIAAALALGLRLAPRIAAAHRFIIWSAGFAVVAALPFLPALAAFSAHTATPVASPTPSALLELDPRWMQAIAAVWLAASLYRAADLAIHALRLRRLWRTATPINTPIAGVRNLEVCTTPHLDRPSVIGFFAPRILIPDWLFTRLTPGELNQIVLHESQHLSRRDDWTNLLQKLCLVVFPLSPALMWIDRRLAREREMACDEAVIRITHAPRAYAACLASLAERGLARRTEALSLGAFERRPELVHRVHSILRSRRALHPVAARAVFAGLACGLAVLSIELAQCPQLVTFKPVAFASAAKPAQAQQIAQSSVADAVYTPRPRIDPQFRVISAKAIMPMAPPLERGAAALPHAPATALPRAQELAATAPTPLFHNAAGPAGEEAQQTQQWIVFTEWEQVETTSPVAHGASRQSTANYDTAQANEPDGADTAAPLASRIRITQLVLRLLPSASRSSRPAAIPLGNGWFVIQL